MITCKDSGIGQCEQMRDGGEFCPGGICTKYDPPTTKRVPIKPTEAMLAVAINVPVQECAQLGGMVGLDSESLGRVWEAMMRAAPERP